MVSSNQPRTGFIVSSPRSGSTWVQRILSSLPETTCIESRAYGRFFEVWPEADGKQNPRMTIDRYVEMLSTYVNLGMGAGERADFVVAGTRAVMEAIHETVRRMSGAHHVVEKVTPYVGTSEIVIGSIARDFPDATLVQLLRDGRDVVTSGVFHWLKRTSAGTDRHRFYVDRSLDRLTRFFDDDRLRLWCRQWREPIEAFRAMRPDAPTLRYEGIHGDPLASLGEALDRLGVRVSATEIETACEMASFERMSGGRRRGENAPTQHVRRGVVGDWKNYFTRRDGEIFVEETGDLLRSLGYETDPAWVEALPDELELVHELGGSDSALRRNTAAHRSPGPMPVVLASGVGRSGTTALRQSLGRHPEIYYNGKENNVVQDVLSAAMRNISLLSRRYSLVVSPEEYHRSFRDLLVSLIWPELDAHPSSAALAAVNLCPELMPITLEIFPGARVICLVRNGLSVVSSRMRYRSFRNAKFEDHCDVWNRSVEMMAWAEEHPEVATVFRQEWTTDAATIRRRLADLWSFIGLSADDAPANHILGERYHPTEDEHEESDLSDRCALEESRADRWTEWSAEQREIFVARCSDSMRRAGYDLPFTS